MPSKAQPALATNDNNAPDKNRQRWNSLPASLPPRGLSRDEAAAYIGVSSSLFDEMVRDRRMPPAKRINARRVWDRVRIDAAFQSLAGDDTINFWDDVAA